MVERVRSNAIERAIVLRTHRNIAEQIARKKIIIVPENSITDFEVRRSRHRLDGTVGFAFSACTVFADPGGSKEQSI